MADSRKKKIFDKFLMRMNTIKKDAYASSLFADLSQGKNSYMRVDRLESSAFDMTWIKMIEDCIYDLGDIISNPKQVTKTVSNIVPVELAKKIGAESVMHLASHTQYIKDITEEGDVVPNKILSLSNEDDIHTYENRFIATLIRRLVLFVEKRYEFVKHFSPLHDEEILFFKTKAMVDGSEVEIETKVKVRSESDTEMADISNKYIDRILKIREYVMYFYGSKFMKDFKTERDVRNPIVLTNILRKNPKYHKCYQLFRFIEKYDRLGVSYKVDEDASIFNEHELEEMNTLMFANYLALKARDRSRQMKSKHRLYKPKILTSIDDEKFVYGDLYEGPIEFIRVDQAYQDYLDDKAKHEEVPTHPTKIEKEYYKEEIEEKTERKANKAELEKLLKRKKKELAEHEKQVQKIIAQREKEERERIAREQEEARLAEERRIDEIRRQLILDAKEDHEEDKSEFVSDEPLAEETPVEEEYIEESSEADIDAAREALMNATLDEEESVEEEQSEELPDKEPVQEQAEEEILEEPVEDEPVDEQVENNSEEVEETENVPEEPIEEEQEEIIEESPVEDETVEDEASEEEIIDEAPIEEVVEEETTEELPEEEPVDESSNADIDAAREALLNAALDEEIVEEEQPVEEQAEEVPEENVEQEVEDISEETVEETPVEEVQEEETSEEPIEEVPEQVIEEPVSEESVEETSNEETEVENIPEKEEKPVKKPVSFMKKVKKAKKKPVQKIEEQEEKPASEKHVKKEKEPLEKIPGKFIVKTAEGYFVNPKRYSVYKHEAKVFDDFNEANHIKKLHGGKVIKL